MAKKFYDIFPPGTREQEQENSFLKEGKKTGFKFNPRISGIFLIFILFLFLLASHTVSLGVKIVIWPETEENEYRGEIKVDSSAIYLNYEEKTIPAEVFEIREQKTRTFFASGRETEEKKAEGTLRVYNNHSSLPQTLVAGTRFLSADGKLFHSLERITIPGRKQEGGRTVPGEIDVSVKAAEPGKEYNIEKSSKFSVPGLQGTAMYTSIYAENPKPITGGYVGELPKITEDDIESARNILTEEILNESKLKLRRELSEDFVISPNLISQKVLNESFYPGIGENSETFEYSIGAELKILSYKESQLREMAKSLLVPENEEDFLAEREIFLSKQIYEESLKILIDPTLTDPDKGEAVIEIESSATVYPGINESKLKKMIDGKQIEEVKNILENYDRIEKAKITYWPPWIKRVPRTDKIEILLEIEQ